MSPESTRSMTDEQEVDPILLETLRALDLPEDGVKDWLRNLERFYTRHGGNHNYARCLHLIKQCKRHLGDRNAI
jgi:hypothetical protein